MNPNRSLLLPTLARTSPIICPILLFMNCIIYPSFNSFYIFIMYMIVILLNCFEKVIIFKPLYNLLGKITLPIIGRGLRPEGAKSCLFTLDNKDANSFGMPSGHSQLAWTLAVYFICKIIFNFINKNKIKKINIDKKDIDKKDIDKTVIAFDYIWIILSCILLILFAGYLSYCRVYIEYCHTIQQVIIGAILGMCGGFIIYYFEDNIKNALHL